MSDNNVSKMINEGGEINFVDIAALSIALSLFISQGDEEILNAIGSMADAIKGSFGAKEESQGESEKHPEDTTSVD